MKKSKSTDVSEALDLLVTEVREEIQRIREEGADAMKAGDYSTAQSVIGFAEELEGFAKDVDRLSEKWNSIEEIHMAEVPKVQEIVSGKIFGKKARKGTITPQQDYYLPLLRALVKTGGSGKVQAVIDEVGKLMEGKLKEKDFERLNSEPKMLRWRNKVMWARNSLVNDLDYMKSDTPHGVWAISEKGRTWLSKQS
jgi:restriction system protein